MRPRFVASALLPCALIACEAPRNEPYAPPGAGHRRDPGLYVGTGSGATNPGTSLSNPSGRGPGNVEGSTTVTPNDSPIPTPAPVGVGGSPGTPSSLRPEPNGTPGRALPVPTPGVGGMAGAPPAQPLR